MYLHTLTLKDFAGLGAVDLDGFEPGLNVIVGDNEAGKSTLLLALRAAFFQKHRATGEAARALAPYNRSVRPEIAVGFETGGIAYRLRKSFLQRPEAELSWPGGALSSDAVEERLAELLRFAHPGSGRPKLDEHQGAFGLLWVEQGRSHEHDLNLGVGKNAVTASLEGEIGQILGGDRGRRLLDAAKTLQDRFFTATGRVAASSPLAKAEEALAGLRAQLAEKQAVRRDYEEKIDRLRSRREVLHSYLSDDAVGEAERGVEAAELRLRAVEGFARALEEARRELEHAGARRVAAGERLSARQDLEARARRAEAERIEAAASLDDTRRGQARELADLARLEAARDTARATLAAAEAGDEAATARAEQRRLVADLRALETRLAQAGETEQRLAGIKAVAAGPAIDAKALQALELAERKRREAEILVTAAAPLVTFSPAAGQRVEGAAGAAVGPATPLPILARTEFALEGFGRVTIEPGGDAGELRRSFDAADAGLRQLLARLGVGDVEEARGRMRDEEDRQRESALLRRQVETILPEGRAAAEAALGALNARLAQLGALADGATDAGSDSAVAAARAERKAATADLAAAQAALDAAGKTAAAFAGRLAKAEAEAEHRAQAARRLRTELVEAEATRTTAALGEDLAAVELDRSAKVAVVALRQRDLDAADPETANRSLLAGRRALEEVRRVVAQLKDETAALEGELRAQGLSALGEDIERLSGEIAVLENRRQRLAIEAEASRLLHETLLSAQREAREHWLGPIKAQVAPYLKLIHPESEVAFDDTTLAITGLHRRGVEEDFKRLSAGAREQVAVVTRLALARVLKSGGHPALVILDDALVNTDEQRLARMHLVLQKAAESMQIIVLTCRERDFRSLGGKIFRL